MKKILASFILGVGLLSAGPIALAQAPAAEATAPAAAAVTTDAARGVTDRFRSMPLAKTFRPRCTAFALRNTSTS